MTRYVFLFLLVMLSSFCFAQTHIPSWVNSISSNAKDEAFDLTTDTLHNYYVTGRFSGVADVDPSAVIFIMVLLGFSALDNPFALTMLVDF